MEQGTGVEPASEAWEATIIADILTLRDGKNYSIRIPLCVEIKRILRNEYSVLFNDISLTRYDIRRCRMIYLLRKYDIISVPIIREAYIICEADIIPAGYITRSDRNGYH